jgi:2-amino-4-hydroxy-6-hydroxymethyldihydropteridine diphosphokinase
MNTAYLGLGSNVDAKRHIKIAVHALIRAFSDAEISPIYQSKSVGFEGEDFLNLVVRIQTELKPAELRQYLRNLEASHGRNHDAPKWSDRTLDIDILLYNDLVTDSGSLKLPRAEIVHFAHVLKPLVDIAPDLLHPTEKKTFTQLWEKGDWSGVELELVDPDFLGKRLRLV